MDSEPQRGEQDGGEEDDDEEVAAWHDVRRCPESRSLQTLRPGSGSRWDFRGRGSLPCIPERPFHGKDCHEPPRRPSRLRQDAPGPPPHLPPPSPPPPPPSSPPPPPPPPPPPTEGGRPVASRTPRAPHPHASRMHRGLTGTRSELRVSHGGHRAPSSSHHDQREASWEVVQLAQRRRGVVRLLVHHMEALFSAAMFRKALAMARPSPQRTLPQTRSTSSTKSDSLGSPTETAEVDVNWSPSTDSMEVDVQRPGCQSDSTIIPLHDPGFSPTTSGAGPPRTSQRFGRERSLESSTSSSTDSSPPHFEEDGHVVNPTILGHPDWARSKLAALYLSRVAPETGSEHLASVSSSCCRICQNSTSLERLVSPCYCKGSLAYVHVSCLERWLNQSGQTHCELCQFQYDAVQTPRYTLCQSMRIWFRHPRNRRQLLADLLVCGILTLVTLGLLAVTCAGLQHFVQEGARFGISSLTTHGTILCFLVLVGLGYLVTVVMLIKDEVTPWLRWQRTNVNVRLTLDSLATPPPARRAPRTTPVPV